MGGALAIGAYTDPQGLDSSRAQRDLKTAKALTYTCKSIPFMYFNIPTSLQLFLYEIKVTKCMPGVKQEYRQNMCRFMAVMISVFHLMRLVFATSLFSHNSLDLHLNIPNDQPFYILRPEVVEAIYYLSFLTGDPIYREWSWEIWQSIEKYCKTKYGYGSLKHVDRTDSVEDRMESFFLAETMKYLYLIFDPDSEIDILHKVSNVPLPLIFFF